MGVRFGFARKVYFTRMGTSALATLISPVLQIRDDIPDPTKTKRGEEKKICCLAFFL
jgi:hypothetical protein